MLRQLIYGVIPICGMPICGMLCVMPTAIYGQSQVPQAQLYYYPAPARPQLYYPAPHQDYYLPVPEDVPSVLPQPQQPQQPQYRSNKSSGLSDKCAQASEYIKNNNCGPQGCDCGLYLALQNGCRINYWGHTPVCHQTQK